jgi:hypothetical protein
MKEKQGAARYFYANEKYIAEAYQSGQSQEEIGEYIKKQYNFELTKRMCRYHISNVLEKAGVKTRVKNNPELKNQDIPSMEEISPIDFSTVTKTQEYEDVPKLKVESPTPEPTQPKQSKAPIEDRLIEECKKYGLDPSAVSSYKFVNHNGQDKLNIAFHPDYKKDTRTSDEWLNNFEKLLEERIEPETPVESNMDGGILILNIADLHAGMDPNFEGSSIWEATWTKEDIITAAYEIVKFVKYKNSNCNISAVVMNLLGDLVDGFNAETTRGGHKLPQNMTNIEQSDVVVLFLYTIVEELHKEGIYTEVYGTSNSNHGGDFEHLTLQKFQMLVKYEFGTKVVISEKLALGYVLPGTKKPIVIMHGKDKQFAVRPFPAKIDDKDDYKVEAIIDAVCKKSGLKPLVFKGDSHQHVIQSKKNYDWVACMTNAPSSDWVKNNFFNSSKGGVTFSMYNIDLDILETGLLPFNE